MPEYAVGAQNSRRSRTIGTCALALGFFFWAMPTDAAVIEGRVVDSTGRPVADAAVFNSGDGHARVEAKTDASGAFRLVGVPDGQICLFVEHPEYRFAGALFPDGEAIDSVKFIVARLDDEIELIRTLPQVLSVGEARELAGRVVNPYLDMVATADDSAKTMGIFALGCIDWLAAVERLDAMPFDDADERQRVRQEIIIDAIKHRFFDDWTECQTVIESADSVDAKAACYTCAARHLFADDRARQQELLNEALLHARAIIEAKRRALALGRISLTLSDLGDPQRAEPLAREALLILDPLPVAHLVSWNVTGTVAEALGRFDLPAARSLVERLHYDGIFAWELGRLACDVALRDTAAAERLWEESGSRHGGREDDLQQRNVQLAAPICYRVAVRDPTAALRIAHELRDSAARTTALAAVAQTLAKSDPDAARRLARDTLRILPETGSSGLQWNYMHTDAAAVCQWLPVLETIDPRLGREFLWRAVSLRPPRPIDDQLRDEVEQANLHLVGLLARYDRRLAESLLAPYLARFDEIAKTSLPIAGLVISTDALFDPRSTAGLFDRLPGRQDGERRSHRAWLRTMWAGAVAAPTDVLRAEAAGYRDPSRYESW
jgi:tetratricopeptide (TPR) repeat protein